MSWRFPAEDDIARAERHVYERRAALRFRSAVMVARTRRRLRSRTALFFAAGVGFLLPSVLRSGVGKRVLAAGSLLRWVSPLLRLLKA